MRKAAVFVLLGCFVSGTLQTCNQPTQHYLMMGCVPSRVSCLTGCPVRYTCDSMAGGKLSKCYFRGKAYDPGLPIPESVTEGSCVILRCAGSSNVTWCNAAYIDCPEFFEPYPIGCFRQYAPDKCCSVSTVCGNDKSNMGACIVAGEKHYEGQPYRSPDDPCQICTCGATNGTVVNGLGGGSCFEQICFLGVTDSIKLSSGAAPVYRKNQCCPVEWRLPNNSDRVAGSDRDIEWNPEFQCKYGNLTLNVGDRLEAINTTLGVYNCVCAIPPMVHCMLSAAGST